MTRTECENRIIGTMGPTTLAGLVADIQQLGTGAERWQLDLEGRAMDALRCLIGDDEADQLVTGMFDLDASTAREAVG